jgi:hypothetical protein
MLSAGGAAEGGAEVAKGPAAACEDVAAMGKSYASTGFSRMLRLLLMLSCRCVLQKAYLQLLLLMLQ